MVIGPAGQLAVSCKSTDRVEMRWNKYEVSLASPVWTQIRQLSLKQSYHHYYYFNTPGSIPGVKN